MKKIILAVMLLIVGVCSVFVGVGVKSNSKEEAVESSTEVLSAVVADTTKVQTLLKKWGYYTGNVDGINGPQTIAAVKKFQKRYGLVQDGIVGPLTAEKMGINLNSGSSSSNYSSSDRYLLAKVIYAEARGESYTGQVAIGAVVLNRVEDSRFPNTIAGVIYQPWAFTARANQPRAKCYCISGSR